MPWQGPLHRRVPSAVEEDICISGHHLALIHGGDCAVIKEPPACKEGRVKQADKSQLQEQRGGKGDRCSPTSLRWLFLSLGRRAYAV